MEAILDVDVAQRFISSLSKSLQALCHGCMEFQTGIEIIGHINVNIDCGGKVDYVLNEKVKKGANNSMTFVSNSFLAKKDEKKKTQDGSCSPVHESLTFQGGAYSQFGHRAGHSHSQPRAGRGAKKRSWSGIHKDWRTSPHKHMRGGSKVASFRSPSKSPGNTGDGSNIKEELDDSENNRGLEFDPANIKSEPDTVYGDSEDMTDPDAQLNVKFLPHTSDVQSDVYGDLSKETTQLQDPQFNTSGNGHSALSEISQNDDHTSVVSGLPESSDASYSYLQSSHPSLHQSLPADQGDVSGDGAHFDVIEVDEQDEDVKAMFGDADAPSGNKRGLQNSITKLSYNPTSSSSNWTVTKYYTKQGNVGISINKYLYTRAGVVYSKSARDPFETSISWRCKVRTCRARCTTTPEPHFSFESHNQHEHNHDPPGTEQSTGTSVSQPRYMMCSNESFPLCEEKEEASYPRYNEEHRPPEFVGHTIKQEPFSMFPTLPEFSEHPIKHEPFAVFPPMTYDESLSDGDT